MSTESPSFPDHRRPGPHGADGSPEPPADAAPPSEDGWQDHIALAHRLAGRAVRRPGEFEELFQVALIGLWKAWERFDRHRGPQFPSFAYRTIAGELKRHRRDKGWMIRPPRPMHDALFLLQSVVEEMTHELSRSPTVAEMADRAGLTEEEAILALDAGSVGHTQRLDAMPSMIADADHALGRSDGVNERAADREALSQALGVLSARDRRIIELRFFAEMSQREIAAEVGLSQMQVSRVIRAALARLRGTSSLSDGGTSPESSPA